MFTRYTPLAIECANRARMEAMRDAAAAIDLQHLTLALLSVSPALFGWSSPEDDGAIRQALGPRAVRDRSASFAMVGGGMPAQPSEALKRVVARAAEDAGALGHRRIAPEHLLAALLGETDAPAAAYLGQRGVSRESILADLHARRVVPDGVEPPTRESLESRMRAWIAALPEAALVQVEMMVAHAIGPEAHRHGPPEPARGSAPGDNPPWAFPRPPGWEARERASRVSSRSSSTSEDGAHVFTTRRNMYGHEVTTVERFRLRPDGRVLSYVQEVTGPKHTSARAIEFELDGPAPQERPA